MRRCTLLLLSAWLSGCALRQAEVVITPIVVPEPAAQLEPPPFPVSDGSDAALDDQPAGLWPSLSAGRVLTDCDYAPGIAGWTRKLAGSPQRFSADMSRLAPWIDWVWREGQALGLPAEVALLPLVESGYRPVIGGFGAPGGWWQLMPGTARILGLRVDRGIDERMDPLAASLAALGMLKQLGERFDGNWLLALIAYNVGPLNVDRWVQRSKLNPAEIRRVEQLPVPRVTTEHVHRLMAFGCILADPAKYRVELLELSHRDQLSRVMLKRSVPSAAIPAALGERGAEWKTQNPQLLRRARLDEGRAVLAPADLHARIDSLGDLQRFARADAPASPVRSSATTASSSSSSTQAAAKPHSSTRPAVHRVKSGDSLWLIARRYDMRIKELLHLNPGLTRKTMLRLGRQIKLR